MRHTRTAAILGATALLTLAGCSSGSSRDKVEDEPAAVRASDAAGTFTALAAKIPTVKLGSVVTADTDPNRLLGRPGQYTSKVTFTDSRIKPTDTQGLKAGDVQLGGAIETFSSAGDAATRAQYIEAVTRSIPALAEYDYLHGTNVIRVSHYLTPVQAKEYETAAAQLG
ncbi:hypothetical protein AB0G73_34550 [Streptomyces sp. NPDC020719]|uniref:hypothetical protein n=1 Tax=Streptomyces sp. NPDC020719 TaxID=3154896 RepID=UPI0033CD5CB4